MNPKDNTNLLSRYCFFSYSSNVFLPNQQGCQTVFQVFHSTKSCHMNDAVSPHLCIGSSNQYSLVKAIWTKLTTKLNHQKSLPVTREREENKYDLKITKYRQQSPYWFCMTLSDASLLWLSFSCYLWQHICIIYMLQLFPFLKSGPQQCCFSLGKKKKKKAYSNQSPSVPTANTDYQKSGIKAYRERVTQLAMDQATGWSPG